jgi:hypothetical protein
MAMGNIEIAQAGEIRRTSKLLDIDETGMASSQEL